MNIKLKRLFVILTLSFSISALYAGIRFGDAEINEKDEIVYTISHKLPGTISYSSLFTASIKNGVLASEPKMITCFPEKMEMLSDGHFLQIRNRYGTAWLNTQTKEVNWKKYTSSIPLNSMRLAPMSVSPDGKWLCYSEKTGYASGKLILESVEKNKRIVIDEKSSFSYENVPVKWLSDSSVFVYAKEGVIYFCNPDAMVRGVEVAEEYRQIGPGTINAVNWADGKYLIYIDRDLVYRINAKELYTLGLYSNVIGKGTAIGRLPSAFISSRDTFSVNDEVSAFVFIQNGKTFTYYGINSKNYDYFDVIYSGPFFDLKSSLLEAQIMWTQNQTPFIWTRSLPYNSDKIVSSVYRLDQKLTKIIEIEDSGLPILSKDKAKCAFSSGTTVHIYNTTTWKKISDLTGEHVYSIAWYDLNTLYIGGSRSIRKWNIYESYSDAIMASSAENGYWDGASGRVVAESGNGYAYAYTPSSRTWKSMGIQEKHVDISRNGRYRLFCGDTPNKNYENALYIRTLAGKAITNPVYAESIKKIDEKKKVAFVFDAYDNADGLTRILYEMGLYNVSGTFFVNGEFIRRYPNETRQISVSKNEVASMFFSSSQINQKGFVTDEDFIRRGLARNEDEYYACTSKELSLLWHDPVYEGGEKIIEAGNNAGYTYVKPFLGVRDSTSFEDAIYGRGKYVNASEIIDIYMRYLKSNGGGLLPVTVGISSGTRENYLYDNLDLLLSAILDSGFDIVPLRYIVEN
ncbi:MAG: polysaccharide deacetylase family protein [Treponema sp.]|nr:polysaccharide deacetylase family protein [Treponema sp.]